MPLTYAFENFEITGGLGDDPDFQAPAIEVSWKWYYSFPTLSLWSVLLLMTFLPKRNRQDRIAPLLIVPLIAECIYQLLSCNITARSASEMDFMIYLFTSLTMAWTAVWILAPWLSRGNRCWVAFKQFILMLLLSVVALGGYYGFSLPENIFGGQVPRARDAQLFVSSLFWNFIVLCLVGTSLGVGIRRRPDRPFRPMLRLLFVLPIVTFGIVFLFALTICLINFGFTKEALSEYFSALAAFWPAALVLTGFIYLLNLPICLMGYRWPKIKERWHAGFPGKRKRTPMHEMASADIDNPCETEGDPKVN